MPGMYRSAGTMRERPRAPRFARERIRVPPLEERFFDLHLPLDSDFLEDMETGALFDPPSISGRTMPVPLDVNRKLIEEAVELARQRGLPPDLIPRFRIIRGTVHACGSNGHVLRLDHSLFWEVETGYAALLDELLELPPGAPCSMQARGKVAGQ